MNRILVPTDFSEIAYYGIEAAVGLAKKMDAQVYLLNCIAPISGSNFSAMGVAIAEEGVSEEARFVMELYKKNEAQLAKLGKQESEKGVHITTSVQIKNLQEAISDFIEEHKIDLVVMGTSGESTYTEFFVGNHTEQVIRISHCPVLSVKQSHPDLEIKNIVLATDLNPEAFEGVTHIKKFTSFFDTHIDVLHVMTNKSDSQAEVTSKLDSFAHRHHFVHYTLHSIYAEDEREGILQFAKEKGADMIAVITHGRTGLANLIFGSVSEELVKQARMPVLTSHLITG